MHKDYIHTCEQCGKKFADSNHAGRKYCSLACYSRHQENTPERFWTHVDKSGGSDACWPWTGHTNPSGYGQYDMNGKTLMSHRIAYELTYGEIPTGLKVCHSCDNRPCCNPLHLWIGTQIDNIKDMMSKSRNARHDGENNPRAKITLAQAREIRTLYANGNTTHRKLSKIYGITHKNIGFIITGKHWQE